MSSPADYVAYLNQSGVRLWLDNGKLRYQAKKGILSSEELARLRSMRTEIVAELTKAAGSKADNSNRASEAAPVEGPVSLQQRWFLRLLEEPLKWKGTLSYTFRLKGALDPTVFERSLKKVLHAHAALRTRIERVSGEWRQQIEPVGRFQLPVTQVSGKVETDIERNAWVIVQNIASQELDPAVSPLMKAQLVRVWAQEHFLVILIHRVAADCLGIGQVFRDLWTWYGQAMQTGPSTSTELTSLEGSTRYRDYALWQHTTDEAWRQKHGAYWNDYLAGSESIRWPMRECTSLPNQSAPGSLVSLESSLGETLSAELRELCEQTQTLLALIMLSVYVACVSMWCRQKDLIIPFLIAGRAAAHEGVVGCFSHVVYLRIRLNGSENFTDVLKLVSNEFYKAAAFRQDSGRMATERPELLRGTLCQWLSWHPSDIARSPADDQTSQFGLQVEKMRCQNLEELTNVPPDMVDLEINFFNVDGDISVFALYQSDRFAEGAPARLVKELRSTAEYVVRDPRAPIGGYLQN